MAKKLKILTVITPKFFSVKIIIWHQKKKISEKIFFSKIFRIFFFENYWKKLGKKNSKWLFWMTNGMFLKKKSWNFEKINFFKILRFWRNRNYRTFPTSTIPKGKIRFFRVHMMSHLRKISLEPINVAWGSNLPVDPCGEISLNCTTFHYIKNLVGRIFPLIVYFPYL